MAKHTRTSTGAPGAGGAPRPPEPPITVVGIGASAGGLAALKAFFRHVPADSGLAYAVVVHLAPDHESHLAELLQPHVRMPVQQVAESTALAPNRVYVIPPGRNLSAVDTHLRLSELEEDRRERAPIDHFFRTLAATHDGASVGVILTGTGSDGTLGVTAIKERNGLVVVQDPADAEYDGMPQSAVATGLADLVLPLAAIPDAILRFARTRPRVAVPADADDVDGEERQLLQKVFVQVRTRTGRDFTHYKRATLLRRIARRMQLRSVEELPAYVALLREQPDEVQALADDLLITVTSFFRDPEVFEALAAEVVPRLFDGKGPTDDVRVWSVGCATGEEAYSLAILLLEEAARRERTPRLQVFASDLHEHSLARAREGFYPGDIATDVGAERLERFFTRENGGYRIRKEVRELVVFAPHNLLSDPPFSRLDLVTCRNVLIYLQRGVQREIVELFHYALRPDGVVVLGGSETVEGTDLFQVVDKKRCVYRKRNVPASEPRLPVFPLTRLRRVGPRARGGAGQEPPVAHGQLHARLVERYAPPSLLMSPDDNVVHLSEHAGRFLVHPGGEPTTNAYRLVREELRFELRSLVASARERGTAQRSRPIVVPFDGARVPVVLHVRPARDPHEEGFALVIFDEREPEAAAPAEGAPADGARVRELEAELRLLRHRLQSTVEEYETGQEELRASNEEFQSANEELRSTLEELETSKEELQSTNEELQTVNQENRHRVEELRQLTDDLQNLLVATDIATLFLDRELRILRFTPQVGALFNVRPADRGRPLSDLTHRLGYPTLQADARRVLETLASIEHEVQDDAGRWYLARLLPYRSAAHRIDGVVLTFVDITAQKRAEEALRESEERQAFLLKVSDALRPLADPLAVIATASEMVGRYLDAGRCGYGELPPPYDHFVVERDWTNGMPSHRGRWRLADFGDALVSQNRAGRTLVIDDALADERGEGAEDALEAAGGLRASIGVPLLKDGSWVAAFFVHDAKPRRWTKGDVELVEEVAERTWAAVERARAEAALRESEARLAHDLDATRILQHVGNQLISTPGANGQFDELCEAARTLMRSDCASIQVYDEASARLRLVGHVGFHPDSAAFWEWVDAGTGSACGQALALGERVILPDVEAFLAEPSEHEAWRRSGILSVQSTPLVARTGQVVGMMSTHWHRRDVVTEASFRFFDILARLAADFIVRTRAEAALRESEERQAFLVRFSDAVRGMTDPAEVATTACRMLLARLDVDRAHWSEIDWTTEEFVTTGSVSTTGLAPIEGRFPLAAWEPYSASHREGRAVVVDDTQTDPRADGAMRAAAARLKIGADLAVPVLVGGRLASVLGVKRRAPRRWTADEIALVEGVAARCWAEVGRARAEAALRESEEKYRTLFEWMGQGYSLNEVVRDAEGAAVDLRYLELNPAFERLTGASLSEARGRLASEVFPGLDRYWVDICDRAVRTGVIERIEHELTPIGRWYQSNFYPIGRDRVLSLYDDITERKLREQHKDYSLKLSDALRRLADPVQIKLEASRVLGEELGVNRALYAEVVGDDWWAERGYVRDVDALPTGAYASDTYGHWIMQTYRRGESLVFEDVRADRRFTNEQRAAAESASIIGAVGVPLVKSGELVALLSVHTAQPRTWTAHDIAIVEETAERTWAAVERARAEAALRESEEKYRTVFESIDEAFLINEMIRDESGRAIDLRMLEANPAYTRQTGLGLEMVGKLGSEILPTLERFWLDTYDRVARTGVPERVENYNRDTDRWYAAHISRVGGDERRVAVVFDDVTVRKHAELALKASEERQAFLLGLSDALRAEPDADAVADRAIRMLIEHLRLDRSYIVSYRLDEDRAYLVHQRGNDTVPPLPDVFILSDYPAAFRAIFDQTFVVEDELERQGLSEAERRNSGRLGMRAMVAATLRKREGRPLWSMVAISSLPRRWTRDEVALVEEVAERTWAAVERVRAEAALRESEERYRALFTEMDEAYAVVEVMADAAGRWTDFLFLEVNSAFMRHTGMPYPVGQTATQLLGTPNPRWAELYGRAAETGESIRVEEPELMLGRIFDLNIFRLGGEGSRRVAVLFTDITARRQAEDAVRESEKRLRRVLDGMGEGFGLLAPDFTLLEHNREALRMDGRAREEIVGRSHWDVYPGSETSEIGRVLKKAMAERVPVSLEHQYAWEEGRARWLEMRAYPTDDGALAVFWRDVTDRREAQDALRASEARQAFLVRFSDAVRGLSDPSLVAAAASRLVTEQLGTERTGWTDIDWTTREYVADHVSLADGSAGEPYRWPLDPREPFVAEHLAGRTVVYDDVEGDPRVSDSVKAAMAARGIRAGIAVPVVVAGTLRAVLNTSQSVAPRRWLPDEVALVEAFASRARAEIERARAEQAMRESEERQAFLLTLSDALTPLRDASEIKATASRRLGEHLGVGRAFFAEIVGDDWIVGDAYDDGASPLEPGRYPAAEYGRWTMDTLRARGVVAVADTASDARLEPSEREALQRIGNAAVVGVPLVRHGEVVAVLSLHSREPREWTNAELELVQEIADRTWPAVERTRAEAALRASEARYRTLFESIDEGFAVAEVLYGAEGRPVDLLYLEANPAASRLTGGTAFVGRRASEVLPQADRTSLQIYDTVARTGQPERVERHYAAFDRWFEGHISPVIDVERDGTHASPRRVAIVFRDVTERRRAVEALRASEERYRTLFETMVQGYADIELVRDADGRAVDQRYLALNPAFERIFGMPVARAVNRRQSELFPGLEPWWNEAWDRVARSGVPERIEHEDASLGRWYEMWAYPRGGDRLVVLYDDVTDRKRAEIVLRESETRQAFLLRLTDALRSAADAVAAQRAATDVIAAHLGCARSYYTEYDEARGVGVVHVETSYADLPPATGEYRLADFETLVARLRTGDPLVIPDWDAFTLGANASTVVRSLRARGHITVPLVQGGTLVAALTVQDTKPRAWSASDVATVVETAERTWAAVERARAEAALRESERKFAALFATSPAPLLVLAPDAPRYTIAEVNDAYLAATMRTREGLVGRGIFEAFPDNPDDPTITGVSTLRASLDRVLATRQPSAVPDLHYDIARPDGTFEERWWRPVNSPILDERGAVQAIIHNVSDVTAERAAAAELHTLNERLEQRVAERTTERDALRRALTAAEEAERRRLARELHDQLGQHLTGFALGLADVRRRIAAGEPAADRLDQLEALARLMSRDARTLALELRPPELDDVGLEGALETYVAEWSARFDVAAEVTVTGLAERPLASEVGSALYRIVQEALTNVAKHADASQVSVIVDRPDGAVRLIVEDDGRGFDVDTTTARARAERRLGLAGMQERAAIVGGTVTVESSPGSGTALYVRLPVEPVSGEPATDGPAPTEARR
ncbi:GAF domain-containing protein [Roseisolibacter agri]|uniref:Protein-glutamate O-methyltransferase n=1 Tax=Roseisolibacter agri TaxID=2014610 RepID=A0AA37V2D9_9BACT|nr:GAF domain-containing protein [Roseisolibacter agri]GLC25122.1 hypothetical protein rosag_16350 [Roseisolibacter agri]